MSTTINHSSKICVYAHAVNGEIFYIGKGTSARAFNAKDRNRKWHEIVNASGTFESEILGWFDNESDALAFEADQISLKKPVANIAGMVERVTAITPERRMTLRLPEILARRVDAVVVERKAAERKFSLNDWLVEAIRGHVDVRTERPSGGIKITPVKYEESVVAPHPIAVLEHAAMAETPIGRSVTDFLMDHPAKIVGSSTLESPEVEMDPAEARCVKEFGAKVILQAEGNSRVAGTIPRWKQMTWQQRHEALVTKRDSEQSWA